MTDILFTILDELYFISTFEDLQEKINLEEADLKSELFTLIEKDWVKCLLNEQDISISLVDYDSNFKKYHYIATKKGLLAHNTL